MLGNRHCPAQIADESKYEVKPPTLPEKKDVAEVSYKSSVLVTLSFGGLTLDYFCQASSVQSDNDSSASEVPRLPRDNSEFCSR